jgi:hypothetical protein
MRLANANDRRPAEKRRLAEWMLADGITAARSPTRKFGTSRFSGQLLTNLYQFTRLRKVPAHFRVGWTVSATRPLLRLLPKIIAVRWQARCAFGAVPRLRLVTAGLRGGKALPDARPKSTRDGRSSCNPGVSANQLDNGARHHRRTPALRPCVLSSKNLAFT